MGGISAQGTRITRNGTDIPNLGDVIPPPLMRRPVEDSRHNRDDEEFEPGIRRAGLLEFDTDFVEGLQDLVTAWELNSADNYAVFTPDGAEWTFTGLVVTIAPKAPVEGRLLAHVQVRPTGRVSILSGNGLLTEAEGFLLTEAGGTLLQE